MDKSIKINVPDGYEAIWNEETGEIDVVRKSGKPRSWEECLNGINVSDSCFYITKDSEIIEVERSGAPDFDRNIIGSREEAEAFLAMMQLRTLRKSWVGEWEPNWDDRSEKYTIVVDEGAINVATAYFLSAPMSFPDLDMANDFMECFKELLKAAKMLL